ncbi:MAG: spore coat protein U domain-containing protein, partial [Hyphomicrobiaceae bacterium]
MSFAVFALLAVSPARAQSCTFTMPSFDYGEIDLTLGTAFDLTANLVATCTGTPGAQIRFCPNLEGGSGGHTSGNPRHMLNGATQLNYNIFRNGAFTRIWGSRFWPFSNPPQPRLTLDGTGFGTRIRPVRVRIFAGQTTLPTGTYTTTFSGTDTLFAYDYFSGQNCAVIGTTNAVSVPF